MMYSLKLVIFLTLFFVLMNFVNLYLNVDMKQMKKPKKKKTVLNKHSNQLQM